MKKKLQDHLSKSSLYKYLNKDIKEFNSFILSIICISILVGAGLISYVVTNSYALFTSSVKGSETIEVSVGFPGPANEVLMSKVGTSGLEAINHSADSTLQIGATEDITEYRFRGGNDVVTNNYVYFNCTDMTNQTADTCDLYRIIGVFPTDDGEGNIENRVKLIKQEEYNDYYVWDSDGSNDWAKPASLNTEFNSTYYDSINLNYQNLIGDAKYYLGGYGDFDYDTLVNDMYKYERKISGSDYYGTTSRPNSWTGKIALMYASDYGYGAYSTCSDTTALHDYDVSVCVNNNWLKMEGGEWLLSGTSRTSYVLYNGALLTSGYSEDTDNVRPVFYLTADANFSGGSGSQSNPYQLAK